MTRTRLALLAILLSTTCFIYGQVDKIVIPAGTPEDQALTAINNEQDAQKRLAMYQDFLEKFASNPAAIAYANWQLSQYYKEENKGSYEFFESAAFNAIAAETDAKTRMDYIDQFATVFPKSKFDEQIASYAMLSLSQLKDNRRLNSYAEKALAANPDNLPALLLVANSYVDGSEPGGTAKALTYAQRAIVAAKADDPSADKSRKVSAGVAHSVVGRAYAKQEKTALSITELKSATSLLKGQDDQQFAVAGYYLGWDYAKLNRLTEARAMLNEVAAISGPVQQPAKDLLTKVNTARAAGK